MHIMQVVTKQQAMPALSAMRRRLDEVFGWMRGFEVLAYREPCTRIRDVLSGLEQSKEPTVLLFDLMVLCSELDERTAAVHKGIRVSTHMPAPLTPMFEKELRQIATAPAVGPSVPGYAEQDPLLEIKQMLAEVQRVNGELVQMVVQLQQAVAQLGGQAPSAPPADSMGSGTSTEKRGWW